jgi:hypothetical protein
MTMKRYTLTDAAQRMAKDKGKIVVKSHSHAMTRRMEFALTGMEWYGPLSLGSKTKLYMVDDTIENRKAIQQFKGRR